MGTMKSLFWAMILLALIIYIFSILFHGRRHRLRARDGSCGAERYSLGAIFRNSL